MNYSKMKQLMSSVNGATFISIDTVTEVKLTGGKQNPLQGRVTKENVGSNVMVFQNKTTNAYENMVNKRLAQEGKGEFTVGPRSWGHRVPNTPFVEHNGNAYLEVIFLSSGRSQYCVDGVPFHGHIDGLPVRSEGEQGGLENKVIIRTFNLDSIRSIVIDKQRHI